MLKLEADTQSPAAELPSLRPAKPISRDGVVQAILNLFKAPDYLEIGVNQGKTFNALRARTKVAVDPKFLFDHQEVAARVSGTTFHETTSDDYFGRIAGAKTAFDVIYLDGMHTSEQTIRDLINAISFLKPGGVIAIDDVFPCSYMASLPDRGDTRIISKATTGVPSPWMGDVFRLVFFVETFCQQFNYATVNNNHGQLVLWREPRRDVPQRTLSQVAAKEYKDLFLEAPSFRAASLDVILTKIRQAQKA
ncbi:class I SAM-dependent methyltransferase [Sphingomonas piscis]|uniref:Class I SAM-dependent methyltransferase n=1 Tax=Sphingomonas piscis TaxID=2714943 RepID=A0A6G7YS78_9SPHN|nr:class I SAM-dependent methyltransferase [Sphingomonas piscis]QIK79589.1 class I SAM-dependent methyltransferase [Sphingomonas piscis]